MTAGSSKSEDKDIIIVAIDEQPIWGDGCRGGEGAGAVPLGDLCVLDKKVCWSNDLGEEQCTTAREPGGSFAVRAIALSKKKIAKFSCEHEIWLFLYFGTALSEDKVLFIPQ